MTDRRHSLDNDEEEEEEIEIIDPAALPDDIDARAEWFYFIGSLQEDYFSPINVSIGTAEPLQLHPLRWKNYDLIPKKLKFINTGYTLMFCARYFETQGRPYIYDGPLTSKYIFSQLHFHWGRNDMEGSEHTVEGVKFPVEMHVVHYNEKYGSQENALGKLDGLCVIAYFYQLQAETNEKLQPLLNNFSDVQQPHSSIRLEQYPLTNVLTEFSNDYLLYWGSIIAKQQIYPLIWFIPRNPTGISKEQSAIFRTLLDENGDLLQKNFHSAFPVNTKRVFHVNPTHNLYTSLLPIPFGSMKLVKKSD